MTVIPSTSRRCHSELSDFYSYRPCKNKSLTSFPMIGSSGNWSFFFQFQDFADLTQQFKFRVDLGCVWSGLSGNLGKTALRLIEILSMYFDTSLKTRENLCKGGDERRNPWGHYGVCTNWRDQTWYSGATVRQRVCKTVAMYKSGLTIINRSLTQARTSSCITRVLVWLGRFHVGAWGTLLWQSLYWWS